MSSNEFHPIKRASLSETVYLQLRDALMEGRYRPGDRLRINPLAKELGVSITPVREAIFRLVSDRALEMKAATAIHVSEISAEDLRGIQTIRVLLEGYAAQSAAYVATPKQILKLESIQQKFQDVARTDPIGASALNRQFHFELMHIANMPVLYSTVENMWVIMGPLLRIFHESTPVQEQTSRRHLHFDVIEALKSGDGGKAQQAIQDDIRLGLNLVKWIEEKAAIPRT